MRSPRWRKLRGDLRATRGRLLLLIAAITLALAGVGTVLATRVVLGREIRASYLGTRPAEATFELGGDVTDELLAEVRARPDVTVADRRQTLQARARLRPEDPWQIFLLFVADDLTALQLNTVRPDRGAWPPPPGALLVERSSVPVMGLGGATAHASRHPRGGGGGHRHDDAIAAALAGQRVEVRTSHGQPRVLAVAGTVHDPGQAPSWQEHRGCGYAGREILAALGEPDELRELLVQFRPPPGSMADVERAATALTSWLRERGHTVHEVRVPKLRQHPHQGLMNAVQTVLLGFTLMLLVLAGIVLATTLSSILARQTREIGVMKAIGASTRQLVGLYGGFVLLVGVVAAAIAVPLAYVAAGAVVRQIAGMMNITLADPSIPAWVLLLQAGLGLAVPLTIAAVPVLRAARLTVREAISHEGSSAAFARPSFARLPIAVRNLLRRPLRLAMTMVLLVAGGALVIAAANVERGLSAISARLGEARLYDVEIRLASPVGAELVAGLARVPGVARVEPWHVAEAAVADTASTVDIVHRYPDGGHGGFALVAAPPGGSALVSFPINGGRWLRPDDREAVVLGHNARAGARVGDRVTLSVAGRRSTWTVVGIAEEIGGGSAYVTAEAFRAATGITGVSTLRFQTTAGDDRERAAIIAALERALASADVPVRHAMPSPLLRTIIDDHVVLVVRAVIFMAILLAAVGLFGLASATAIGVAERTREIAVMKAIGAGAPRIFRIIVTEALTTGAAAALLACALSLPLTAWFNDFITRKGFLAPPPFAISWLAMLGWPLALAFASALAALLPARRAAGISIREALGES